MMRRGRTAGQAREIRQRRERDVHPERPRPAAVPGHPRAEVRVHVRGIDEPLEQELRIDVGDDALRLDHVATLELDPAGPAALDQLYATRPALGAANYRMPVQGLYLCGAGAHPGGGVTGIPGRNAAREILRDARRRK